MKTYSDNFSYLKRFINKVGKHIAATALFLMAAVTLAFSQEPYHFIEGSIHSFSVEPNPSNTFAWMMDIDPYNEVPLSPSAYDLIDGGSSNKLTIRFNDINRGSAELVYLVVRETAPNGCSTRRALQIMLEPNNMYLEFASANTQDCFTGTEYNAPLKVGLNFKDKAAGVPIPESRFPLRVEYTVRNITAGTPAVEGNSGNPLTMQYSPENDYALLVTEAVGTYNETTEYELTITSVRDKYDAEITNNSGDIRLQIRVINHLPQSGNMDMALAYYEIIER